MTGAEEITRAGQFLYAVVRYLESCGVLCGINMTSGSDNYTSDCEHDYRIKIRLKNPGEYLDPNVLSGVLSSSFYRSVIFANEIKIADDNGLLVSMGLGQAWSPETGAKPGQITLSLGNITDPDTQIREFIKALGAA